MEAMTMAAPTPPRLGKAFGPVAKALAGRRFFPLWAVVHHRGRKSGRELTVPVAVRTDGEAFVVTLPWGARTNWARNVLAAGGCVVRWKGVDHTITAAELIGSAEARPYFGRLTWSIVQKMIKADTFIRLHQR
jgi:deazaflavin-dependent oxidoreductase (nitroreductase family)